MESLREIVFRTETALDRYAVVCGECDSLTWFDNDEEMPLMTECWRCGEIINPDL